MSVRNLFEAAGTDRILEQISSVYVKGPKLRRPIKAKAIAPYLPTYDSKLGADFGAF